MYSESATTSTLFPSNSAVPPGRSVVNAIPTFQTNSFSDGKETNPCSAFSDSAKTSLLNAVDLGKYLTRKNIPNNAKSIAPDSWIIAMDTDRISINGSAPRSERNIDAKIRTMPDIPAIPKPGIIKISANKSPNPITRSKISKSDAS